MFHKEKRRGIVFISCENTISQQQQILRGKVAKNGLHSK